MFAEAPKAEPPGVPKPAEDEVNPVACPVNSLPEEKPVLKADFPFPKGACLVESLLVENVNADAKSDMAVPDDDPPPAPETVLFCAEFDDWLCPGPFIDNAPNSLVSVLLPFAPLPKTLSNLLFPPVGIVEDFICESWKSEGPADCGEGLRTLSEGRANGFFDPVGCADRGLAILALFGALVDTGVTGLCAIPVLPDNGGDDNDWNGEPVLCGNMVLCRNGFGPVACGIIGCTP